MSEVLISPVKRKSEKLKFNLKFLRLKFSSPDLRFLNLKIKLKS